MERIDYKLFKKTLEKMSSKELQVASILYLKDIKDLLVLIANSLARK